MRWGDYRACRRLPHTEGALPRMPETVCITCERLPHAPGADRDVGKRPRMPGSSRPAWRVREALRAGRVCEASARRAHASPLANLRSMHVIARSPRLASLLSGGLLCGISFTGCGGAELGAVEAPASAAPPARPLDRAGLVWVPRRDQIVVVEREGERAHVLAGPWRGIVEGERATWAPARTVDPIQSAIACAGGRGWVFTTRSQLVATADTFLGELRVLGAVRLDASQGSSREVAVHRDGGDAWVADCDGLRPITVPGGPIDRLAFSDASFGAALLSGGASR